jgi:hypothetical protein
MSAIETFHFGQWTLRPAVASLWDFRLAKEWTNADPDHAGRVPPGFWTEQTPTRDSYLVTDHTGPLMFFKTIVIHGPTEHWKFFARPEPSTISIELHMQFAPRGEGAAAAEMRDRIAAALMAGLPWLEQVFKQKSVDEIFFDTRSPALIRFCVKRLGFKLDGRRLRKQIRAQDMKPLCKGL